jgi:hypothetical protein
MPQVFSTARLRPARSGKRATAFHRPQPPSRELRPPQLRLSVPARLDHARSLTSPLLSLVAPLQPSVRRSPSAARKPSPCAHAAPCLPSPLPPYAPSATHNPAIKPHTRRSRDFAPCLACAAGSIRSAANATALRQGNPLEQNPPIPLPSGPRSPLPPHTNGPRTSKGGRATRSRRASSPIRSKCFICPL